MISAAIQRTSTAHGITHNVLEKAAPTGVAANAIRGQTIHSLFKIPITSSASGDLPQLTVQEATNLRNRHRDIEYFVIDEKSMIGCRMLHYIDHRMRQIFEYPDLFFGGRNVVLMGDFHQLPPVAMRPLFSDDSHLKDRRDKAGRVAFLQFSKTIELTQVVRQEGNDQASFRAALDGLRHNTPTQAHWRTLARRIQSGLRLDEVGRFDNALRIYSTNSEVREFNSTHLERLDSPVVNGKAINTGPGAEAVDSKDAGNLHNSLALCRGGRVMLTENLWTEAGLVNGAMGVIYDIAWPADVEDPRQTLPFVVLVKMDQYSGPACMYGDLSRDIVPIFLSKREFEKGKAVCSRTQFPLTIAYAITVHKSQGATLDQAVLNIATRQFTAGLTYVAVSRVKKLEGLMFEAPFTLADLKVTKDNTGLRRAKDFLRRRDAGEILNNRPVQRVQHAPEQPAPGSGTVSEADPLQVHQELAAALSPISENAPVREGGTQWREENLYD